MIRPIRPIRLAVAAVLAATPLVALAAPAHAASTPVVGVSMTWELDAVAQNASPFGVCHYFSAGSDDGSATGYAATAGDVSIGWANGVPPTYATRCGFLNTTTQRVTFAGGTGTADATTGARTIRWTGAFTADFYGGLAPFTFHDPVLTVDDAGEGVLSADLTGYATSRSNPTDKTPIPEQKGVVVATLHHVGAAVATTVTPAFAGVTYTAPQGGTAQDRTVDGWGSWPTAFADFQQKVGLGSYWYTSGGSDDPNKVPAALTFSTLALPGGGTATTTSPTPTASPTASGTVAPQAVPPVRTCSLADGVTGGSLVWGFKKSFREYVASGPADNSITASNGAVILPADEAIAGDARTGTYRFAFGSERSYASTATYDVQYAGQVVFRYPSHYFTVTMANPRLAVTDGTGAIFADVTVVEQKPNEAAKTTRHDGSRLADVSLARSSTQTDGTGFATSGIAATLHDASAFSFDGNQFYRQGQALDAADVAVLGCQATTVAHAVANRAALGLAETGLSVVLPLVAVLLVGAGMLVLVLRRRQETA